MLPASEVAQQSIAPKTTRADAIIPEGTLREKALDETTMTTTPNPTSHTLRANTPSIDNLTTTTTSTTLTAVASGSTVDHHPPITSNQLSNSYIPRTYARLSDRYAFSFSKELIEQFDKYRSQMRVNIQRELEQKKDTDEQGQIIQSPFESFDYINNEQQNDNNHRSSSHSVSPKPAPTTKTREVSTISSSPKSCFPRHRKSKSVDGGLNLSRFIFSRGKFTKTNQGEIETRSMPDINIDDDSSSSSSGESAEQSNEEKRKRRKALIRRIVFFWKM